MKLLNNRSEKIRNILVPVLSVIMGFLLGAIIMVIFGYDPVAGYQAMFETAFQGKKSIGEIFVTAAPLIFTALGFSVANSAGFFNIGLSGQALCGWVASIWVALSMPDAPRMIALPVAIIVGAVAGALAAAIPGFLRAYFGTSEVIVTIMLNYILLYTGNHIANNVMKPSIMANKGITKMIGANASLRSPFLTSISDGSRLNIGIFLAFIFLILVWFLMKKPTLGFEIGILLSALLFGMLKLGGQGMPLIAGVPTELGDVVIAAIIFFVGISYLIRFLLAKASGSKKEVAIVETIEAAPDKNNQEGGDI